MILSFSQRFSLPTLSISSNFLYILDYFGLSFLLDVFLRYLVTLAHVVILKSRYYIGCSDGMNGFVNCRLRFFSVFHFSDFSAFAAH